MLKNKVSFLTETEFYSHGMASYYLPNSAGVSKGLVRIAVVLVSLLVITLPSLVIRPQHVAVRHLVVPKKALLARTSSDGAPIGSVVTPGRGDNRQAILGSPPPGGLMDAVAQNGISDALVDDSWDTGQFLDQERRVDTGTTPMSGVFGGDYGDGRAQISFARYASSAVSWRPPFSEYQLGGVSVSGPILSGRALARDRFGQPVGTLSQPNLLVAGRGFIPGNASNSQVSSSENEPVTQRSTTGTPPTPQAPPPRETPRELRREKFRIFDFEEREFGFFTIFRTLNGSKVEIGSLRENDDTSETITLNGPAAISTWEEFVGELFLIAVEPGLVGGANTEGFEVRNLDPQSHILLMRLRTGDTIQSIGGIQALDFTIQSLPDLLLDRKTIIQGIRGGERVILILATP